MRAQAAKYDVSKLIALAEKFPDGKYWNHIGSPVNNPDGYTSTPCTHHAEGCSYTKPGACECNWYNSAIQCMGYSFKLGEEIVGTNARTWKKSTTLNASSLRVGDIIRYYNDTHSIVVVGVKGDVIAYTGANWGGNCLIKWSQMNISEVTGFSYVLHDENNNRTNTDIAFYQNAKPADKDSSMGSGEVWQMNGEGNLNVRREPSVSSEKVGSIPAQGCFYAGEKRDDGTYLWAKVRSGTVEGWAVLNYSKYLSGVSETLKLESPGSVFAGARFSLKCSSISAAEKYTVKIYDKNGKLYKTQTAKSNCFDLSIDEAGEYRAVVCSENAKAPSWVLQSETESFTVLAADADAPVRITLPKTQSLAVGEFSEISATVYPTTARESVSWSSSNEAVATVLSDGTVLAHQSGTAVITCKSASDSAVSSQCAVSVKLDSPQGFSQNTEKTDSASITLNWKAVKGADGYRVYRVKSNGSYKLIADVNALTCKDTGLSSAQEYRYNIRAYQKIGGKNHYSDFFGVICAVTPPKAVTGLTVTDRTEKGFTLTWNAVQGADAYYLYRYDSASKKYLKVKTLKTNSIRIKQKAPFYGLYRVAACVKSYNITVLGEKSSAVYGFATPSAPTLQATASKTKVTLSWQEVPGATSYIVYQKKGSTYKKVATVKGTTLKYTVGSLKRKTAYTFKIKACTKHGAKKAYSDYSKAVTVSTK